MLSIGLPKGSVIGRSRELVRRLGSFKLHEVQSKRLSFRSNEFEFFLLKHRDIPNLVSSGKIDIGITSSEWVAETDAEVSIVKYLDWCDTRVSLVGPVDFEPRTTQASCVTEFPNIAKLSNALPAGVSITRISGSTEALVPSKFDCGVDCVETGRSLKENNLIEISRLFESRVCVIARPNFNRTTSLERFLTEVSNLSDIQDEVTR